MVRAKNLSGAIALAQAALQEKHEHPTLLGLRSLGLQQQGRVEEALADLARAVEMAPGNIEIRNSYGSLLGLAGRWEEAAAVFAGTLTLVPQDAATHFQLAQAHEELRELDAARRHYERAAELAPQFVEPLPRLATLALNRGDLAAATAWSDRALALRPGDFAALVARAQIAIAERGLDKADAIVRRLVAATPQNSQDGAIARGVLGDLRHAQRRYAQAFSAYTTRNRALFHLNAARYGGEDAQSYCRWLTEQFSNTSRERWSYDTRDILSDDRDGATGHAFVVGFPRSGTTLLESILAAHPGVVTLDERETLLPIAAEFLLDAEGCERLSKLGEDEIAHQRARYWQKVKDYGADVRGKFLVDKYPLAALKLPLVAKLFPHAKIIFALRDPRDVVLSCFRHRFGINASTFQFLDLPRAAHFFCDVMALCEIYREKLDLDWHELRHEALVGDFDGQAHALCDFLGLAWSDDVRDFAAHARGRTISTPSASQVVRGLNRDGVAQWRNYENELSPVMGILAPWVEKLGYA